MAGQEIPLCVSLKQLRKIRKNIVQGRQWQQQKGFLSSLDPSVKIDRIRQQNRKLIVYICSKTKFKSISSVNANYKHVRKITNSPKACVVQCPYGRKQGGREVPEIRRATQPRGHTGKRVDQFENSHLKLQGFPNQQQVTMRSPQQWLKGQSCWLLWTLLTS